MQTRRTESRRVALPLFICLRDRKDGAQRSAYPLANKDPHAEIYMALHAHILHAYTYAIYYFVHTAVSQWDMPVCRLMKVRVKTRNLRLKSRSRAWEFRQHGNHEGVATRNVRSIVSDNRLASLGWWSAKQTSKIRSTLSFDREKIRDNNIRQLK